MFMAGLNARFVPNAVIDLHVVCAARQGMTIIGVVATMLTEVGFLYNKGYFARFSKADMYSVPARSRAQKLPCNLQI